MGTTNLSYYRLNSSSYQKKDFFQKEQDMFESLGVLKSDDPFNSDILISNTHTDINSIPLSKLSQTKLLLHPNSGYDNIDATYVSKAPFPILVGNSIRAHGVSEYIISRLFKHFTQITDTKEWDTSRSFNRKLLKEQSILIIGYGHIGKLLEKSLRPLVKNLKVHDPFKGLNAEPNKVDVVLLAASLNKTSRGLIDKEFLQKLNPEWVLVNAARGPLVVEKDLINELENNPKATAYLDVFEVEPFDNRAYLNLPNLFTTSHIAGVSENLDDLIIEFEQNCTSSFLTQRSNDLAIETHFKELLLKNKLSADISFLI